MSLIEDLNKGLSEKIEGVMSQHFPEAKKHGHRWQMGNFDGDAGSSCGVYRGRGGIYLATDGDTINILNLLHRKLGGSWVDTIAEAKRICGIRSVQPVQKKPKPKPKRMTHDGIRGTEVARYWKERGIDERTLVKYDVRQQVASKLPPTKDTRWNEHYSLFPFRDSQGQGVMYKWIGTKKNDLGKKEIGTTFPQYATLWGWPIVTNNDRSIMICEGEGDALSLAQMQSEIPVLSVTSGVSNLSWIDNDFERLEMFETIYICMDMDDAGEQAAQKIAKRLGLARCFRISLPEGYKDANEYLQSKEHEKPSMEQLIKEAKTYDPSELRAATEMVTGLAQEIERFTMEGEDNNFIWPELPFRVRQGEMTVVTGFPSHGKSQWLYQAILHEMMHNDRRVCIASYEIPAANMLFNLLWMWHGRSPNDSNYKEALKIFEDKLWFIEGEEGSQSWGMLKDDFAYAAKRFGCDLFVVDALLHITTKGDAEGTDKVAKSTAKFCVDNDVSLMLVAHADAKKRRSGDEVPEVEDILGGQGIGAAAHNVVAIWRNRDKQKKLEEDGLVDDSVEDGRFYLSKQRATGNLILRKLWFNPSRRTFHLNSDEARTQMKEPKMDLGTTNQPMPSGDYAEVPY